VSEGSAASFPPGSFLAGLDEADRRVLIDAGRPMTLPDGSSVLFQGDDSGRVVVILRGTARIFATAANGREVLVTVVGPGEILGEMSALDGLPHSASSRTIGEAEVVLVPGERFRSLLGSNATLAVAVALRLTRELRRVVHQRVDLEAFDVPTRLARSLVDLTDRISEGDGEVELPVSQQELAEWCGASREAVTKALGTFRTRGWVRTGRRSITVLDVEALRARAS
jgi:CRP/FNR family transcriptional regulator, cyclic AMP receptor protein